METKTALLIFNSIGLYVAIGLFTALVAKEQKHKMTKFMVFFCVLIWPYALWSAIKTAYKIAIKNSKEKK